jgi:hypothetical protein
MAGDDFDPVETLAQTKNGRFEWEANQMFGAINARYGAVASLEVWRGQQPRLWGAIPPPRQLFPV